MKWLPGVDPVIARNSGRNSCTTLTPTCSGRHREDHTHTHTHPCMRVHTNTRACTHTLARSNTHTHAAVISSASEERTPELLDGSCRCLPTGFGPFRGGSRLCTTSGCMSATRKPPRSADHGTLRPGDLPEASNRRCGPLGRTRGLQV